MLLGIKEKELDILQLLDMLVGDDWLELCTDELKLLIELLITVESEEEVDLVLFCELVVNWLGLKSKQLITLGSIAITQGCGIPFLNV